MATGSKSQRFTYRPGIDDTFFSIFNGLKTKKKVSITIRRALYLFMGLPDEIINLPKEVFEEAYITRSGDQILTGNPDSYSSIKSVDMRFQVKSKKLDFSYSLKDTQFQELLTLIKNNFTNISPLIHKSILFYFSFTISVDEIPTDEIISAYQEKKSSKLLLRRIFLISEATLERVKLTAELQNEDISFNLQDQQIVTPTSQKETDQGNDLKASKETSGISVQSFLAGRKALSSKAQKKEEEK